MHKYKTIDLFAGAGGLSLGFEQTRQYEIKAAYENNPKMQKTYKKNHPGVELFSDVCSANYLELNAKYGPIEVVIGGPPCQGFSNANRQRSQAINKNNMLVKQFIRAVVALQPKAFVMENVSMLKSDVHRFYMEKRDTADVKKYNIPTRPAAIHLLDSEYLFPDAKKLVADEASIKKYLWPYDVYLGLNIIFKASKNAEKRDSALEKHQNKLQKLLQPDKEKKLAEGHIAAVSQSAFSAVLNYYSNKITADELIAFLKPAIMLQRMLQRALEIIDNDLKVTKFCDDNGLYAKVDSFAVFDYLKAILESTENNYTITSGVLCAANFGAPQKRMRFVIAGVKRSIASKISLPEGSFAEEQYRTVQDAIGDLEALEATTDAANDEGINCTKPKAAQSSSLGEYLRDAPIIYNHIVTKTTKVAMERFKALKQGENFHALDDRLKKNTYTNIERTQNTIYLRLKYNKPCGTVVNVRKSMWIHPVLDRAISIREAARLQTFPDSFIFCGTKDSQYQQVGNAVPPIMAKAVASWLAKVLENTAAGSNKNG